MKQRWRYIFISTFAAVLVIILLLFILQHEKQTEEPPAETDKSTVVIRPPETSAADTDKPPAPLPYEGETLTLLGVYDSSGHLGDIDGEAPNVISQISYERNLRLCAKYGVNIVFKYTTDVYADVYSSVSSGIGAPADILNINMLNDAPDFLMKGGAFNLLDSGIDLTGKAYNREFIGYFTQNENCQFLLGSANPSLFASANVLIAKEGHTADALDRAFSDGEVSFETFMGILRDEKIKLTVDAGSLHTLMLGESLFGFEEGEPYVRTDAYVKAYSAVVGYSDVLVASNDEADVYIAPYSERREGYKTYRLPSAEGGGVSIDMSRLYAFAIPVNLSKEDSSMVFTLTDALYTESVGIYDEEFDGTAAAFDMSEKSVFCFFRIFGWGDFADHAYSAFISQSSADALREDLAAPETVSCQALKILYERYK